MGIHGAQSMKRLADLTYQNASHKSADRHRHYTNNILYTNTSTQCNLSQIIVGPCLKAIQHQIALSFRCISQQTTKTHWFVLYQRNHMLDNIDESKNQYNILIPYIQRKRSVTIDTNNYLHCSCLMYKNFGYPCRHMYHILNVKIQGYRKTKTHTKHTVQILHNFSRGKINYH